MLGFSNDIIHEKQLKEGNEIGFLGIGQLWLVRVLVTAMFLLYLAGSITAIYFVTVGNKKNELGSSGIDTIIPPLVIFLVNMTAPVIFGYFEPKIGFKRKETETHVILLKLVILQLSTLACYYFSSREVYDKCGAPNLLTDFLDFSSNSTETTPIMEFTQTFLNFTENFTTVTTGCFCKNVTKMAEHG